MTQIPKEILPHLGEADQIGLRMRCINQLQADAVHRALRDRFQVSRLMNAFHVAYTHHLYITASAEQVSLVWSEIEAAVSTPTSPQVPTQPRTFRPVPQTISQRGSTLEDLRSWQNRFRKAIQAVRDEIPRQSAAVQEISLIWVEQQIQAGNAAEVESILLNRNLISPTSALRAQIALYSRTQQYNNIVALYESRRDEVVALPPSGGLAEQLVGAYLHFAEQSESIDAIRTAQQIAQTFLPELERLRQANGVRELLRTALSPTAPPKIETNLPISEQIALIIQAEPDTQISQLVTLQSQHPGAHAVGITLADAYAEIGDTSQAIITYDAIVTETPTDNDEMLQRSAEVLLDGHCYQEVIERIPSADIPPALAGLRGAALYWADQLTEARICLEWAWEMGERGQRMLLPLARLWSSVQEAERALGPYRILLDTVEDILEAEDYAQIAESAYLEGSGDIAPARISALCEQYIQHDGLRRCAPSITKDILKLRADLQVDNESEKWQEAYTDWLEWLAQQGDSTALERTISDLRDISKRQILNLENRFVLLEAIEPYTSSLESLRIALAGEYQDIAIDELQHTLRQNRPLPAYISDLRRALHFLDRDAADMLADYIESERLALTQRNQPIPDQIVESSPTINMATVHLALIGGHDATRREVINELQRHYALAEYIEVAPSSEAHIDRELVRERTTGRNLVVVITGYTGHDLTNLVRDLQRSGDISDRVMWLKCRGKSGVVREIVSYVQGTMSGS